jgi:Crp-like helix-turn-helix protein
MQQRDPAYVAKLGIVAQYPRQAVVGDATRQMVDMVHANIGREPTRVEVGLIGYEGMTGTSILLGSDRTPHSTYIQAAGEGQRIGALKFRRAMETSKSLRMLLLRYVQVFMVQTAHTAISNARGRLDARLARWLLMAHDRVRDETLPLTHEFLSLMLGVRRAGVTEALHSLESQKLIYTGTRKVALRNRKGLERVAGSSYGTPEAEFRRLIS